MTILCEHCQQPISLAMAKVTQNRYGKDLCIKGQEKEIRKSYTPRHAEEVIKRLRQRIIKNSSFVSPSEKS